MSQQTEQQREKERKEREQRELKEKGGNVEQGKQQEQDWQQQGKQKDWQQQGKQQQMGQQQGQGLGKQGEYKKYEGENIENKAKKNINQ